MKNGRSLLIIISVLLHQGQRGTNSKDEGGGGGFGTDVPQAMIAIVICDNERTRSLSIQISVSQTESLENSEMLFCADVLKGGFSLF